MQAHHITFTQNHARRHSIKWPREKAKEQEQEQADPGNVVNEIVSWASRGEKGRERIEWI